MFLVAGLIILGAGLLFSTGILGNSPSPQPEQNGFLKIEATATNAASILNDENPLPPAAPLDTSIALEGVGRLRRYSERVGAGAIVHARPLVYAGPSANFHATTNRNRHRGAGTNFYTRACPDIDSYHHPATSHADSGNRRSSDGYGDSSDGRGAAAAIGQSRCFGAGAIPKPQCRTRQGWRWFSSTGPRTGSDRSSEGTRHGGQQLLRARVTQR